MQFLKNCELSCWDIKNGFQLDRATALALIQPFDIHVLEQRAMKGKGFQ